MGWVVLIRDSAQVEYRLSNQCGCDLEHAQTDYRLTAESDMQWIGRGLVEVGLTVGDAVVPEQARLLVDGHHPLTGEQLVKRKREKHPGGKLPAAAMVEAIRDRAQAEGKSTDDVLAWPGLIARFGRMERGIVRDGEAHKVGVDDLAKLAKQAGLSLDDIYGADDVAEARRWANTYVDVGIKAADLTIDLPKSVSAAYATASPELAAAIERMFLASVDEAVAEGERWTAYGMAGHHGDGQRAERVETSGFLGWRVLHRSARPVDDQPGDPHLHAHVVIAHMARCEDGKWRSIANGMDDLMRHARVVNEIAEARLRARLIEDLGARFERDPATGAWELEGIPEQLRTAYSRRSAQVLEEVGAEATPAQKKAAARKTAEAKDTTTPETDVRTSWRDRAQAVVGDVDAMQRQVFPGPDGGPGLAAGGGPRMPSPEQFAELIWDGDLSLVAHQKVVTKTHIMAAVAAASPYLLDATALERLTDQVLAVDGHAVRLRDDGRAQQSHRQRYTHTSVLQAETVVVEAAMAGLDAGWAELTVEAAEMAVSTFEAERGFALSDEQRAVVQRLLTAGHGVDAVVGVAGAGKTTLLSAAHTGWRAAGLRVAGATTAAVAGAGLQAETGIPTRTVAAWCADIRENRRTALQGVDVLVVDEAAMVDDRDMATLLINAALNRVKAVAVGDPLQLQAIGIGGGFARVHQLVAGLALTENRRQRDAVERLALQTWRDGGRESALAMLAGHDRVHATDTPEQAMVQMLAAWDTARERWEGDPHGQTRELLLLAARNADVDLLNGGARALLRRAGQLGDDVPFALAGGERRAFAVGDLVRVRRNDYRTRRGGDVDVLNGYRGTVLQADRRRGVLVEWTRPAAIGDVVEQAWISPRAIAEGALSHGYAMTVSAAQGQSCTLALAYGPGADAYALYPGLSRAREATHLWLPLGAVEDPETRARLGDPTSDQQRLDRAVAAFGRDLQHQSGDRMVLDELAQRPVPTQPEAPAVEQAVAAQARVEQQLAQDAERQAVSERAAAARMTSTTVPDPESAASARVAAEGFPSPPVPAQTEDLVMPGAWRGEEGTKAWIRAERQALAAEGVATTWRQRPQGAVRSQDLPGLIEDTAAKLQAVRERAERARAEADRFEQQMGTEHAPAAAKTTADAERLTRAQALDRSARDKDDQVARMGERAQALRGENAGDNERLGVMNRRADSLAFKVSFQSGRVRADADVLRERIAERHARIEQLEQDRIRLRTEAANERVEAAAIRRELGTRHGDSDTDILARRIARHDQADGITLHRLQDAAANLEAAGGRGARHLAELRAEADHRGGLDPRTERAEQRERRLQQVVDIRTARRDAERHQERMEAFRREEQDRSYRPEPPSYGGPSLGR